ncbi:SAM-dependent methlyltransferase [Ectopseudomonas composti]|uniref:SAM-dependent methlyltransferase n=2 Tax=Ectopseudomonas composti TaxID=658457 RepID=A0ABN0SDK3_9GAMM|nr:SAM-dependent methlyltransferase [Pseudomonas composti]
MKASVASLYESQFAERVDSLIWDEFVKPWLFERLQTARDNGAQRYLDFACGTGRILKVGHNVFGNAQGIDISESMLSYAKQRVPAAHLHCLDVTRDDNSANEIGAFDCVTMFRFLRNAEPELRRDVLHWLAKHMNKNALLVVNNHGNTTSMLGFIQKLAFWLPDDERNLLSRQQTFDLLTEAGFSVESWDGYRILPSLFGRPILGRRLQTWAERSCRRLGLARFGGELVIVARRN